MHLWETKPVLLLKKVTEKELQIIIDNSEEPRKFKNKLDSNYKSKNLDKITMKQMLNSSKQKTTSKKKHRVGALGKLNTKGKMKTTVKKK